jgi:hypothetical protein
MGSDVGIMGVGATRMKSAAGIYINDVPDGKPGTIAERQAKRMTGGFTGGVWGEGVGTGGPLDVLSKQGGPMAEVAKALSKGPTKEQQDVLASAMSGTEANTAIIAAAVTGRPLGGLGGGRGATGTGTGGVKEPVGNVIAAAVKAVNNQTSAAKGLNKARGGAASNFHGLSGNDNIRQMSGLKAGGLDTGVFSLRGTKASSLASSRTLRATGGIQTLGSGAKGMGVSKSGFSTPSRTSDLASQAAKAAVPPQSVGQSRTATEAGLGSESGAGAMEIKGEMLVKFNNKAFENTMADVVVTVLRKPAGIKASQDAVFGAK